MAIHTAELRDPLTPGCKIRLAYAGTGYPQCASYRDADAPWTLSSAMPSLKFVQGVWKDMLARGGLEPLLLDKMTVTAARPGSVQMELQIEEKHLNRLGGFHGGVIASIIDIGGSLAVASNGLFGTGVTVDLNSTFVAASKGLGHNVLVNCKCDKLGRTLAYTTVEFRDINDRLLARGSHTKYIVQALKDPKNVPLSR